MTSPDEMLSKLRANPEALEVMSGLCKQQSYSLDELDPDILTFLASSGLVKVVKAPMAPVTSNGWIQRQSRCVLTSLGEDLCSVLLDG